MDGALTFTFELKLFFLIHNVLLRTFKLPTNILLAIDTSRKYIASLHRFMSK